MSQPIRTCVCCRQHDDQSNLVRLVLSPDGDVVVDFRRRLPGTGVWVHPTQACVTGLDEKPSLLNRAFKQSIAVTSVMSDLKSVVFRGLGDGLSQASAGSGLIGGADMLTEAIKRGEIKLVILADDASPRMRKNLEAASTTPPQFVTLPINKHDLGQRVGKSSRAAVGVLSVSSAAYLIRLLRVWGALG